MSVSNALPEIGAWRYNVYGIVHSSLLYWWWAGGLQVCIVELAIGRSEAYFEILWRGDNMACGVSECRRAAMMLSCCCWYCWSTWFVGLKTAVIAVSMSVQWSGTKVQWGVVRHLVCSMHVHLGLRLSLHVYAAECRLMWLQHCNRTTNRLEPGLKDSSRCSKNHSVPHMAVRVLRSNCGTCYKECSCLHSRWRSSIKQWRHSIPWWWQQCDRLQSALYTMNCTTNALQLPLFHNVQQKWHLVTSCPRWEINLIAFGLNNPCAFGLNNPCAWTTLYSRSERCRLHAIIAPRELFHTLI